MKDQKRMNYVKYMQDRVRKVEKESKGFLIERFKESLAEKNRKYSRTRIEKMAKIMYDVLDDPTHKAKYACGKLIKKGYTYNQLCQIMHEKNPYKNKRIEDFL